MKTTQKARFFTVEHLGPKRSLTPEGFLLCRDVPIARTGLMIYGPGEVPVEDAGHGYIKIEREEDEVFRPETIASYNGKPVIIDHPSDEDDGEVNPQNWKDLAVGIILEPRRGTGVENDLLLADLLITTQEGIDFVQKHTDLEVSCGYDAGYEELAPGHGRQMNIVGNHVALVENGRCGPRCRIGDRAYNAKEKETMTSTKKKSWRDKIKDAFMAKDVDGLNSALEEAPVEAAPAEDADSPAGAATHIHIHQSPSGASVAPNPPVTDAEEEEIPNPDAIPGDETEDVNTMDEQINTRFEALEAQLEEIRGAIKQLAGNAGVDDADFFAAKKKKAADADPTELPEDADEEAPPGTSDSVRKTKDSAFFEDSFQETVATAEIIAPGIQVPTYDKALAPQKTLDAMCTLRRKALKRGLRDQATAQIIADARGGRELTEDALSRMTCDSVRMLFTPVGAMVRRVNDAQTTELGAATAVAGFGGGLGVQGRAKTPAEINKQMAEYYKA